MITKRETVFSQDLANKKLNVVRSFGAPLDKVWDAWTKSEMLDQWWAPRPYKAVTKTMDFREGGYWLYQMVGPDPAHCSWCKESYTAIDAKKKINNTVNFCDENGVAISDFPAMYWKKEFSQAGNETTVNVEITFDSEADLQAIVQMGLKEGFDMGMGNLDELLGE